MKSWKERIIRFAIKNRKSPMENRRLVGKNLSLLAVFLFAVFLVNFCGDYWYRHKIWGQSG